MSGIGEIKSSIEWTCDICFNKFKCFRSLHLHRSRSNQCLPDQIIRKRFPKKTEQLLLEESNQNVINRNQNSNELSSISQNDNSNNVIQSSSVGFEQSHHNDNLDYEDEDNDHHGLDNLLQMDPNAALLGENSEIMVNNKYIAFQHKFQSLIKNPNGKNIEGPPSNNNLNSPNNDDNELRSQSGLSSHLSLGRVSSITRSIHADNNISPGSSRISTGYANPKDILNIFIYVKTTYLSDDKANGLIHLIIQLFRNHPPIEDFFT